MNHVYDADADHAATRPFSGRVSRMAGFHDLPDLTSPPRRRLNLFVVTGLAFAAVTGIFYGGEALLPAPYKPSVFIGGYGKEIEKARKAGELDSQLRYETRLRGVEVQFQTRVKGIETAAIQLQEQCRAGLTNANNLYQAAYTRANIFAQATADIQKQYAASRYQLAQQTLGGEIGAANTATTFGYILGFFDPELGQKSFEFAEAARQQALKKLDEAAKGGITVSVDGWNHGLPDPASLAPLGKCDLPVIATGGSSAPITLSEQPAAQPSPFRGEG